jgi:CRISPR-associated protein (TIGR02710 family)
MVYPGDNPWETFADRGRRDLSLYFNRCEFVAAELACDQMITHPRVPKGDRAFYQSIKKLVQGYGFWDRFEYMKAWKTLRGLENSFMLHSQHVEVPGLNDLVEALKANLAQISRLADPREPILGLTSLHVIDLVSNAERRAEQGRYDDGVLRMYRALEMVGQIEFVSAYKVAPNRVPVDHIPDDIREEYRRRYYDGKSGYLKLPLTGLFNLLEVRGKTAGRVFRENEARFRAIISSRNDSFLAHGANPVNGNLVGQFASLLRKSFGMTSSIRFPNMPWE